MKINSFIDAALDRLAQEKGNFAIKAISYQVEEPIKTFGDYSTNAAFELSKITNISLRESAIALMDVIKSLEDTNKYFEKVEEKDGFINFWLNKKTLVDYLTEILGKKIFFPHTNKTVVIDYSSPNIARPFGIGHFRSTNIGAALYNIYKFLGWRAIGDNHLGDWGTQFGSLIYQIKNRVLADKKPNKREAILKNLTIADLEQIYVDFHKDLVANPQLEDEARLWFKKLEDGDREARNIWKYCVDISLKEFNGIYKLLNVRFDYSLGESFYQAKMKLVVEEAKKKGLAKESQGALIIDFNKGGMPPGILIKSDGGTTYLTRDLAALKYRFTKFRPDLIIYEVGVEQELHFKQLFEAEKLFNWNSKCQLIHIAHGLFESESGKLSTRAGQTIHLEDVINEAIQRTKEVISKSQIKKDVLEKQDIIEKIAIGALKYNDLGQHYSRNIVFNWDKVLNLEGNSGPYLQYTYARIQSVLKKANRINSKLGKYELLNEESSVLRQIIKFPDVIQEAGEKFSPHLICNYLFSLSQSYNNLYSNCPILKAEDNDKMVLRLKITESTGKIIKICLGLLGIETPEQM